MKQCSIIIGSSWGDEGKGHMTDICCNFPSTLNIRFNGGAQASHTVVTPDGKRHAFRHFGAGTFNGAKTYLSEKFIINTIAFIQERNELIKSFNIFPCEYVNPNCIVTTPWDMYINQGIETLRANNRHGSCGFGINETVERSEISKYKITVMDLLFKDTLIEKLLLIQNEYVPMRLKDEYNVSISDFPSDYQKKLTDPENINMFLFYAEEFLKYVQIRENEILNRFDNLVFEGAQGLLLDQNNIDFFPHVTTSNTGIKNVMEILNSINYSGPINIYYVSRCYSTRHGVGPFPCETNVKPYPKIQDLTNVPNEFQGTLRFGILDFDLLISEINKDLNHLIMQAKINITFTCIDQLSDCVKYKFNEEFSSIDSTSFLDLAWDIFSAKLKHLDGLYITDGLTRDCFKKVKP